MFPLEGRALFLRGWGRSAIASAETRHRIMIKKLNFRHPLSILSSERERLGVQMIGFIMNIEWCGVAMKCAVMMQLSFFNCSVFLGKS